MGYCCVPAQGLKNRLAAITEQFNGHQICESAQMNGDSRIYSTVTDLARLRGWSTSVPLKSAM
jgi:hypothetical protein